MRRMTVFVAVLRWLGGEAILASLCTSVISNVDKRVEVLVAVPTVWEDRETMETSNLGS